MPISRQVRITRRAISPLLAISTFLNILTIFELRSALFGSSRWLYLEQGLIVFNRRRILYKDLDDPSLHFALDLIEKFHRLDDAYYLARLDVVPDIYKRSFVGRRTAIECPDHRALYRDRSGSGGFSRSGRLFRGGSCRRCRRCSYGSRRHRGDGLRRNGSCNYLLNRFFLLFDRQFESFLLNAHFSNVRLVDHFDQLLNLFKIHIG